MGHEYNHKSMTIKIKHFKELLLNHKFSYENLSLWSDLHLKL